MVGYQVLGTALFGRDDPILEFTHVCQILSCEILHIICLVQRSFKTNILKWLIYFVKFSEFWNFKCLSGPAHFMYLNSYKF